MAVHIFISRDIADPVSTVSMPTVGVIVPLTATDVVDPAPTVSSPASGHCLATDVFNPAPTVSSPSIGHIDLDHGQQFNASGAGAPYTFTMPSNALTRGQDNTPTGIRNVGPTAIDCTINARGPDRFWRSSDSEQLTTITATILPGCDALFVWRTAKGWVPFVGSRQGKAIFEPDSLPSTISPNNTARLDFAELLANPANFELVGTDEIKAVRTLRVQYSLALDLEYTSSMINETISVSCSRVTVSGTISTAADVPLNDAFESMAVGSFQRSHRNPSGWLIMPKDSRISFDLTNNTSSDMDLDVNGFALCLEVC